MSQGFEGLMIRVGKGNYENKRSKKLYFIEYLLTAAAPTLCIQIGHNVVAKFGVNVVAGLEAG